MNETTDASAPGRITWRLGELMAQRNHMSQAELERALIEDGAHVISRTQVGRLVRNGPEIVSLALIGALCRILQCSPDTLFGWVDPPAKVERTPLMNLIAAQGTRGAERVPAVPSLPGESPRLSEADRARIVGPPARALPTNALLRKPK